jgi:hypothetical protein
MEKAARKGKFGPKPRKAFLRNNKRVDIVILQSIRDRMTALRKKGHAVNAPTAMRIIHRMLAKEGVAWRPKRTWVCTFLRDFCGWTWRTRTKAAGKRPANADQLRINFIARQCRVVEKFKIVKSMYLNLDETACPLLMVSDK